MTKTITFIIYKKNKWFLGSLNLLVTTFKSTKQFLTILFLIHKRKYSFPSAAWAS
jgi:hypothetical protein